MIGADKMLDDGFRGEGMLIAILDAGFKNANNIPAFKPIFDENRIVGTYDFVENNPELTVYAAYGKGEESRYKNLSKYPNAKIFNAGSVTEDGEDVSATNLRKAIRDENEGEIRKSSC
jgi:hypothetical protein